VRLAEDAEPAGRNIERILSDSAERYISSVLFEGIGYSRFLGTDHD
jgi:hypothetical protein